MIRLLGAADLTDVLRLSLLVREAPSWTYDEFRKLASGSDNAAAILSRDAGVSVPDARLLRRAWVAEQDARLVGLAAVQCLRVGTPPEEVEAELESVLVHPDTRRQGVAARLLAEVVDWCRQQQASVLRLEVRTGNQAALSLYAKAGFRAVGCRPRYYRNPEEDAVLMELRLPAS